MIHAHTITLATNMYFAALYTNCFIPLLHQLHIVYVPDILFGKGGGNRGGGYIGGCGALFFCFIFFRRSGFIW